MTSDAEYDWRGETCGACGWFIKTLDENGAGPCRNWPRWPNTYAATEACPAFVPRELPEEVKS